MSYTNGWDRESLGAALNNGLVDIWDYLEYDRGMADLWEAYGKNNIGALVEGREWESGAYGICATKDVVDFALRVEDAVLQVGFAPMESPETLGEMASYILNCALGMLGNALHLLMEDQEKWGLEDFVYLQGVDSAGYLRREDSAPTAPFRNVRKEMRILPAFRPDLYEGDQLAYVIEDAEGLFWVVWEDQQQKLADFLEKQC